jgi:hypothetical protein
VTVTVRRVVERLHADLGALTDALTALERRVADTPPDRELQLAQSLSDTCDTMAGWAAEARDAVSHAAADYPERAAARLVRVHRLTLRTGEQLTELISYARVADVVAAGQEGGQAWRDWALEIRDALDTCREALARVQRRVCAAWEELADAVFARGVSVHAVSIGPQVSMTPPAGIEPQTSGGDTGAARS